MSELTIRTRGPLHRVAATDYSTAEEVLKTAALLIVPEDQTQRQAFEKLMPHLYVLRNRGCSWAQLTRLLTECGFKLQPSTVRTYFSEMLAARMDVCQARMNEQISLLAAIRTETAGADMSAISEQVSAFMARRQQAAAPKVNAMFGLDSSATIVETVQTAGKRPAVPSFPKPAAIGHIPPQDNESADSDDSPGDFGLLGIPAPTPTPSGHPSGFFNLDESDQTRPAAPPKSSPTRPPAAPTTPPAQQSQSPAKQPSDEPASRAPAPAQANAENAAKGGKMRVSPLQDCVVPLPKRDTIPADVYDPDKVLEHPAIPGLMLTMDQRLYGAALEYCDEEGEEAGVLKIESQDQKRFRTLWRQRVQATKTRTGNSFIQMDQSLFRPRSAS